MSVVFRGSRADLVEQIRGLAAAVSGAGPDPHHLVPPILTRGAITLLSRVQGAFIVKARGGTGDDGITWAPLQRATIAARRTSKSELKSLGITGRRTRGFLTPAEDKRWKGIFASTMARLRARGMGEDAAMGIAGQTAWAILKSQGAKTKLEVLGGRKVEIGRDTGVLLNSLTPGYQDSPARPDGQILEVRPGQIIVGSSVPYAGHFHKKRPLWPEQLPDAWMDAVYASINRGIVAAITQLASQG